MHSSNFAFSKSNYRGPACLAFLIRNMIHIMQDTMFKPLELSQTFMALVYLWLANHTHWDLNAYTKTIIHTHNLRIRPAFSMLVLTEYYIIMDIET